MRWASTWSGPFWASSSMTKIAVSGQYLLCADGFDDPAQGQVVAGHAGLRRERAGAGARGVVLAQAHDHEARQVAVLLELLELAEEGFGVVGVAVAAAVEPRRCRSPGTCGRPVPARAPSIRSDAVWLADAAAVFAVAAIGKACAGARVPDVAARGIGQVAVVVVVDPRPPRVGESPVAGDVIGVVGHRRPGMAVGRDVAVAVEVVEQHELLGQLVMVGRHLAAEHDQRRIAVAARQVAEDLIVGAILLDDVDDVLDRRGIARPWSGSRSCRGRGDRSAACRNTGSSVDRLACTRRASCRRAPARSTVRPKASCRYAGRECPPADRRFVVRLLLWHRRSALDRACSAWSGSPCPRRRADCLPSGVTATEVGYQPVGMKPLTWLFGGASMSITATQLLSALATYRVLPSGATASASGVLPSGACGKRAVWIVSVHDAASAYRSPRQQLLDAQATNSRSSLGCKADLVRMLADGDPARWCGGPSGPRPARGGQPNR